MSNNSISKSLADFLFFQIAVKVNLLDAYRDMLTKDEINKIDKNKTVWAKTNDGIITPNNWNDKKDIFFKQRMETYNKSYTDAEKINLELEKLKKLAINKTEYKVLKNRYSDYLLNELQQPQQNETGSSHEIKENEYPEIFIDNAFDVWQSMFNAFKITQSNYSKDIDFMYNVMIYNNLIHDHIGKTDIKNWISKVYEITFDKIRFTNPKEDSNKKRLVIFNQITSK
jgi:hypothetical protein